MRFVAGTQRESDTSHETSPALSVFVRLSTLFIIFALARNCWRVMLIKNSQRGAKSVQLRGSAEINYRAVRFFCPC